VLAGGHHRVTAVISKAEVAGGQSPVVLSKHHRQATKCMSAAPFRVSLGVGIGRLYTMIDASIGVFGLSSRCCGSRKRRDYRPLHNMLFFITVVFFLVAVFGALVSKEQGEKHGTTCNLFEDD
jgi:hypothetical protein